eukprot:805462-Pelagomonas_calceolata.AAC.1
MAPGAGGPAAAVTAAAAGAPATPRKAKAYPQLEGRGHRPPAEKQQQVLDHQGVARLARSLQALEPSTLLQTSSKGHFQYSGTRWLFRLHRVSVLRQG